MQCPDQQGIILSRHLFLIVIAFLTTTLATAIAMAADNSYVGSSQCESCHAPVYASWKTSHHFQAMLPATAENVLGINCLLD